MAQDWSEFEEAGSGDEWGDFEEAEPRPSKSPRNKKRARKPAPVVGSITGAIDGDTLRMSQGPNLRLWGVDAPELNQPGWRNGVSVPIGQQSQHSLADLVLSQTPVVGDAVMQSYGRPVAPVTVGGMDAGEQMLRGGNAWAAPQYLASDPERRFDYTAAERLARQNGLGVHGVQTQSPAEFREDPQYVSPRENVGVAWDTPTPFAGLTAEAEQRLVELLETGSKDEIMGYVESQGFRYAGEDVDAWLRSREQAAAQGRSLKGGILYADEAPMPLTDAGDGAPGAAVRGMGSGFAIGALDELGAVADTFGGTPGRENVWNSERRLADIWLNNQRQNASILGYDRENHPVAYTTGEVVGAVGSGFVLPYSTGARTIPQLARVGAGYGAAEGFLDTDGSVANRLTGAAIGAPIGMVADPLLGVALEAAAPVVGRALRGAVDTGRRGAQGVAAAGRRVMRPEDAVNAPEGAVRAVPEGDEWEGFEEIAGDGRAIAMEGETEPSISGAIPRPQRMDEPASEAVRQAAAENITPADVLPIPGNRIADADDLAAKDAGRIVEARAPDERGELTRQTVRNYRGRDVPKVGPIDMVGWLRLRGGLADQGGELRHMGIASNAPRRGMEHVGQEMRFGPLVRDEGMNLDDAAFAAWEAGYFPEMTERPSVDQFLDALRETYEGSRGRRFLPEDLAELDAFEARRMERYDLEQQQHEVGGPVYRDLSSPAEEPAPFPPPEAYEEWPDGGPDLAGNIRLEGLESPQDIKRALVQTERRIGFDAATRGRIAHAETERLASELNMSVGDLLRRRKGQAFNAEEALAARQLLAKSGNELVNAARKLRQLGDDPGSEALAEFRHRWMRHVAIQEQVAGMTAEAGRALQQFRQIASSRNVRGEVLSAFVRGGGGRDNLLDAAEAILDAAEVSPGRFNALTAKAAQPKWRRRIGELYINFLLSNPATHIVNMTSNTLTAMAQLPEHATAALIGKGRQAFSRNATDRIIASEVGARAFGLIQGAREGARMFANAVRTGEPSDHISKVEGDEYKAIPGLAGEIIRVPTRLLTAEDELFKGIARRMELNGLAARQAHREGLKGEAAKQRIAELSTNPSDELLEQAAEYGRYLTFQSKLGPFAQSVSNASQENLLAKFFLPFIRTPTNLLKFAAERSPAAPLMPRWRKEIAAGGARRDLAIARMMIGTGFGLAIYQAALAGHITGALPSDPKKARLLRAEGWQEYSFKVGDKYYSYKRLDPFAMTIGVAADLATLPEGMSEREKDDKAALLVASIMGNLASKTWLSGISDLVSALDDPARSSGNMLERLVGSLLVPAGVAGIARAFDPTSRQVNSVGEAVMNRVPGLRDNLLPRRDIWGEVVVFDSGFLSPAYTSTAKNDPVNLELLQLGYAPGYPGRKVGGRELTEEEYDRYLATSGTAAHDGLTQLVGSPEWRALDDEGKIKAAQRVVRDARSVARSRLFEGAAGGDWSGFEEVEQGAEPARQTQDEWGDFEDLSNRDVIGSLESAIPGIRFTSGFRTPEYQADMRRRGYKPASNSTHLSGAALDMLPPPGRSLDWLRAQVSQVEPDARLLVHDGHLHATFPDWRGAPVLGAAVAAGVSNPARM